jgi:hypothetical protein
MSGCSGLHNQESMMLFYKNINYFDFVMLKELIKEEKAEYSKVINEVFDQMWEVYQNDIENNLGKSKWPSSFCHYFRSNYYIIAVRKSLVIHDALIELNEYQVLTKQEVDKYISYFNNIDRIPINCSAEFEEFFFAETEGIVFRSQMKRYLFSW